MWLLKIQRICPLCSIVFHQGLIQIGFAQYEPLQLEKGELPSALRVLVKWVFCWVFSACWQIMCNIAYAKHFHYSKQRFAGMSEADACMVRVTFFN